MVTKTEGHGRQAKVRKPVKKTISPAEAKEKLTQLIPEIYEASSAAKKAREDRKAAQEQALPVFKIIGETTVVIPHGNLDLQATLVEPEDKPQLDAEPFLKSLTAAQRKAVTKTTVDLPSLENAIARGVVTIEQVMAHSPMKPGSAAHLRITASARKEQ